MASTLMPNKDFAKTIDLKKTKYHATLADGLFPDNIDIYGNPGKHYNHKTLKKTSHSENRIPLIIFDIDDIELKFEIIDITPGGWQDCNGGFINNGYNVVLVNPETKKLVTVKFLETICTDDPFTFTYSGLTSEVTDIIEPKIVKKIISGHTDPYSHLPEQYQLSKMFASLKNSHKVHIVIDDVDPFKREVYKGYYVIDDYIENDKTFVLIQPFDEHNCLWKVDKLLHDENKLIEECTSDLLWITALFNSLHGNHILQITSDDNKIYCIIDDYEYCGKFYVLIQSERERNIWLIDRDIYKLKNVSISSHILNACDHWMESSDGEYMFDLDDGENLLKPFYDFYKMK